LPIWTIRYHLSRWKVVASFLFLPVRHQSCSHADASWPSSLYLLFISFVIRVCQISPAQALRKRKEHFATSSFCSEGSARPTIQPDLWQEPIIFPWQTCLVRWDIEISTSAFSPYYMFPLPDTFECFFLVTTMSIVRIVGFERRDSKSCSVSSITINIQTLRSSSRFSKDIAPKIIALPKKKNSAVKKSLQDIMWISRIILRQGLEVDHIEQFVAQWKMVANIELTIGFKDTITWKFTKDGTYPGSAAYKMQFEI
jgi:hypothetical protein